eukprot:NODE_910_length_2702_cov_9.715728.p1 GENE.NODE_910_length_2702_cov_9.715728~~NODE_910_length_2702_cov_9.715728.p1  ORF type:complete len:627 (-),score=33.08 NODE_910_length_2702_cov_9.715728:242-2122(-)
MAHTSAGRFPGKQHAPRPAPFPFPANYDVGPTLGQHPTESWRGPSISQRPSASSQPFVPHAPLEMPLSAMTICNICGRAEANASQLGTDGFCRGHPSVAQGSAAMAPGTKAPSQRDLSQAPASASKGNNGGYATLLVAAASPLEAPPPPPGEELGGVRGASSAARSGAFGGGAAYATSAAQQLSPVGAAPPTAMSPTTRDAALPSGGEELFPTFSPQGICPRNPRAMKGVTTGAWPPPSPDVAEDSDLPWPSAPLLRAEAAQTQRPSLAPAHTSPGASARLAKPSFLPNVPECASHLEVEADPNGPDLGPPVSTSVILSASSCRQGLPSPQDAQPEHFPSLSPQGCWAQTPPGLPNVVKSMKSSEREQRRLAFLGDGASLPMEASAPSEMAKLEPFGGTYVPAKISDASGVATLTVAASTSRNTSASTAAGESASTAAGVISASSAPGRGSASPTVAGRTSTPSFDAALLLEDGQASPAGPELSLNQVPEISPSLLKALNEAPRTSESGRLVQSHRSTLPSVLRSSATPRPHSLFLAARREEVAAGCDQSPPHDAIHVSPAATLRSQPLHMERAISTDSSMRPPVDGAFAVTASGAEQHLAIMQPLHTTPSYTPGAAGTAWLAPPQ